MGIYCYEYPRPAVTVDAVVLTKKEGFWSVLLIRRKNDPFKDHWALPGGFVDEHETLEEAIQREVKEELNIKLSLEQFHQFRAYSDPYRDPRQRTITVVFIVWVESEITYQSGDDAKDAQWFPIVQLPKLAFDHVQILADVREYISGLIQAKGE